MVKVRILRTNPNSISAASSQFVSSADVSQPVALLFEDYRKGRKTLAEALDELAAFSHSDRTILPTSVYVNVSPNHASIFFIPTNLVNRSQESNDADLEAYQQLGTTDRGLKVYFEANRVEIRNLTKIKRVDLHTEDFLDFKIDMSGEFFKPGIFTFFKCYEVIGISDEDIEWSYLMAAQDWYDMATNNCLSFSKRIIRELHKQILGGDELGAEEMRKLNKLYISSSAESAFDGLQSRLSSVASPRVLPWFMMICIVLLCVVYMELRLQSGKKFRNNKKFAISESSLSLIFKCDSELDNNKKKLLIEIFLNSSLCKE